MSAELKAACESVDAEFDRQFGDAGFTFSVNARRHLDECGRCRDLYGYLAAPASVVSVPPELSERVEQVLKSSLRPVKQAGSVTRIASQLFLAFMIMAAAVASFLKPAGLKAMTGGELAGVTAALAIGAALLALSLAWQMIPGSLPRFSAKTAITMPAAAFLVTVTVLFPWRAPEEFFRAGWHCLGLGMVLAVPAAILFGSVVRRGAGLGGGMLGATSGAIAGLVSVTILQANCAMQEAIHMLVWHGGVLVVSTVAGYLIGRSAGPGGPARTGGSAPPLVIGQV
jgi:hypothetical protein